MTIQFPADKFVNDTYDYNGLTYVWDGEKWTASGAAAFEDAYVNVTGDTMTGDLTVPSLNGGPLAGFRNQLINGDFRVWQRGVDVTATGYAGPDRWHQWTTLTTPGSAAQSELHEMLESPGCFAYSARVINTSSADSSRIEQGVELVRAGEAAPFLSGSTWTLSYYATAPQTCL